MAKLYLTNGYQLLHQIAGDYMKKYAFVLFLFMTDLALAQVNSNGGDSVVCKNSLGVTTAHAAVLDYIERELKWPMLPTTINEPILDVLEKALLRLSEGNTLRVDWFRQAVLDFIKNSSYLQGVDFKDIEYTYNTYGRAQLLPGCQFIQTVLLPSPYSTNRQFVINNDVWPLLDSSSKVALAIESVLFYESTQKSGATSAGYAQKFTTMLFKENFWTIYEGSSESDRLFLFDFYWLFKNTFKDKVAETRGMRFFIDSDYGLPIEFTEMPYPRKYLRGYKLETPYPILINSQHVVAKDVIEFFSSGQPEHINTEQLFTVPLLSNQTTQVSGSVWFTDKMQLRSAREYTAGPWRRVKDKLVDMEWTRNITVSDDKILSAYGRGQVQTKYGKINFTEGQNHFEYGMQFNTNDLISITGSSGQYQLTGDFHINESGRIVSATSTKIISVNFRSEKIQFKAGQISFDENMEPVCGDLANEVKYKKCWSCQSEKFTAGKHVCIVKCDGEEKLVSR